MGAHTVRYFSEDYAGNFEAARSATFDLDLSAPVTTAALSPAANGFGWNNSAVKVTLSATDNGGPGVANTFYSVDNASCVLATANTSACTRYTAAFPIAAIGNHTVRYFSVDYASNVESERSHSVNIDETAPVTTATLSGTRSGSGYTGPVTVKLTATDNLSGVASTRYTVNGGALTTYTGPFNVNEDGSKTITFHSVDKAENVEATKSISFLEPPAIPVPIAPANGEGLATGTTSTSVKWAAVSGATSYTVQVSTASCGGTVLGTGHPGLSTSFALSGLSDGKTYYWRVQSTDGAGSYPYSNCFSFSVAPAVPVLTSPANGATLPTGTTSTILKWDAVTGANSYTVEAYTGSCGGTLTGGSESTTTNSLTVHNLSNGKTYYWRVAAKGSGGSSPYSGCFHFTN
jgi:hypothetical protein